MYGSITLRILSSGDEGQSDFIKYLVKVIVPTSYIAETGRTSFKTNMPMETNQLCRTCNTFQLYFQNNKKKVKIIKIS